VLNTLQQAIVSHINSLYGIVTDEQCSVVIRRSKFYDSDVSIILNTQQYTGSTQQHQVTTPAVYLIAVFIIEILTGWPEGNITQ